MRSGDSVMACERTPPPRNERALDAFNEEHDDELDGAHLGLATVDVGLSVV